MAETPLCHTCQLRGLSTPASVRGWHRSRWRLEAACAEHAGALARVTPLAPAVAPPSAAPAPPPWVRAGSPRPGAVFAGLVLPPRQPARPRPAPAADPVLCRTCQLRGTSTPAAVRGWHRSRWQLEAACAEHARALARPLPLGAPAAAPALADAPAGAPSPAAAPTTPPARARRRQPALVAAGGIVVAGAAVIVGVVAAGGSSPSAPAPAPVVSGASVAATAGAVRVPQLIGRSLSRTRGSLEGVRLVVARRRTAAARAGVILAQRPDPGVRVPRGSALLVTVALPVVRPAPNPEAQSAAPVPVAAAPAVASAPGALPAPTAAATCGAGWGQAWGAFRCR